MAPNRGKKILFVLIGFLGIAAVVAALFFGIKTMINFNSGLKGTGFEIAGDARSKARDAVRIADIRQISSAMEMYWGNNKEYLTSPVAPMAIPPNMSFVPQDPKANETYSWVDNSTDNQKFCVYVELENKKDCQKKRYYVASPKGSHESCDVENWTLNCP